MTTSPTNPAMAMEIMLSNILDKVFYNKQKSPQFCWDCDGDGVIDVEVYRPHGFNRDIGVIDVEKAECESCNGTGEIQEDI